MIFHEPSKQCSPIFKSAGKYFETFQSVENCFIRSERFFTIEGFYAISVFHQSRVRPCLRRGSKLYRNPQNVRNSNGFFVICGGPTVDTGPTGPPAGRQAKYFLSKGLTQPKYSHNQNVVRIKMEKEYFEFLWFICLQRSFRESES